MRGRNERAIEFVFPATVIVLVVIYGIHLARVSRPKNRNRAIDQMIRHARLALPPELEAEVVARVLSRQRATILGAIIAGVVAAAPIYFITDSGRDTWSALLLLVAGGCGAVIGAFISEARSVFSFASAGPRLARSRTPVIADYLSVLERWYPPAAQFLALALLIAAPVLMVLTPERVFAAGAVGGLLLPAGLLVTSIAAWAVSAAAARHLLGRGQPAGTMTELAWDDALRTLSLRAANDMPAIIAFASSFVTLFTLSNAAAGHGPGSLGSTIVNLTGFGFLLVMIPLLGMAVLRISARRPPRYLKRLWPETAAQITASLGGYGPILSRDESGSPAWNDSMPADQAHPNSGSR